MKIFERLDDSSKKALLSAMKDDIRSCTMRVKKKLKTRTRKEEE